MILVRSFTIDFVIHFFFIATILLLLRSFIKLQMTVSALFTFAVVLSAAVSFINHTYFPKFSASTILFGGAAADAAAAAAVPGEGFCGGCRHA